MIRTRWLLCFALLLFGGAAEASEPSAFLPLPRGQMFSAVAPHPATALVHASLASNPTRRPAPGLAFLASLALPGAGQLLNGDRRGYLYLGVEAGAWFARASYLDASRTKEGESEQYARRHWDHARWSGDTGDGCLYSARADSALSALADRDLDRYYDALGKQDDYRCGWDDFRAGYDPDAANASSAHRLAFRKMRNQSNDLKDKARLAMTVLVLNRIVSGIDAFQTARRARAGGGTALHLESSLRGDPRDPRAVLALTCRVP